MELPTKFVGDKSSSSRGRGKTSVPPSPSMSLKKTAPEDFVLSQSHAFCENLKAKEKETEENFMDNKNEAKIMKDLRKTNEPLIGLEYITEYQSEDEEGSGDPIYKCDLCQYSLEKCTVVNHIAGNRHRLFYLRCHFPYQYDLLLNLQVPAKEFNRNVVYQAEMIEYNYGRRNINIAFKNSEVPGKMELPTKFVGEKSSSSRGRGKRIVPPSPSMSLKKTAPEDFLLSQSHAFCENLKAKEKETVEDFMDNKNEAKIMKNLRKTNEPLIGLEYITEYQSEDKEGSGDPIYKCDLCQCSLDKYTVVNHIVGNRHRLFYLRCHFPYQYDLLLNLQVPAKEINRNVVYQAEQIENIYGRRNINIAFKNREVPVQCTKCGEDTAPACEIAPEKWNASCEKVINEEEDSKSGEDSKEGDE